MGRLQRGKIRRSRADRFIRGGKDVAAANVPLSGSVAGFLRGYRMVEGRKEYLMLIQEDEGVRCYMTTNVDHASLVKNNADALVFLMGQGFIVEYVSGLIVTDRQGGTHGS